MFDLFISLSLVSFEQITYRNSILHNSRPLLVQQNNIQLGSIEGNIIYPSDYIPAHKICAEEISNKQSYCIELPQNQNTYSLSVPQGTYRVYALACSQQYSSNTVCQDTYMERQAFYTDHSVCGFTYECSQATTGQPIPVQIEPDTKVKEINPDWYSY